MGVGGGVDINTRAKSRHILYTRHIVTTSSTQPYTLMKILLTVYKVEGILALIIKGRLLRKYNSESCRSCMLHIVMTCSA